MADGRTRHTGLIGIALVAVMSGGCFRAEAKTPTATPALQTPEPPARLVIPVSIDPPAPTPAPTPTPVAPARPATSTSGRAAPPGQPPTNLPPPVTPPVPETTPPPTVLQTNLSQADLERRAKDRLDSAEKDLLRVSGKPLGKDALEQFESAKRFVRMAQDALTAKNFVYAVYCADKAATLASLLAK